LTSRSTSIAAPIGRPSAPPIVAITREPVRITAPVPVLGDHYLRRLRWIVCVTGVSIANADAVSIWLAGVGGPAAPAEDHLDPAGLAFAGPVAVAGGVGQPDAHAVAEAADQFVADGWVDGVLVALAGEVWLGGSARAARRRSGSGRPRRVDLGGVGQVAEQMLATTGGPACQVRRSCHDKGVNGRAAPRLGRRAIASARVNSSADGAPTSATSSSR
jgi:hypothetical protein